MILLCERKIMLFDEVSRDQPGLLAQLNRLGAPAGSELVEHTAGMGLHSVFADKEPFRDFAVAEPRGDQPENLKLARSDGQLGLALLVDRERPAARGSPRRSRRCPAGESQSQPDTEPGEQQGHKAAID